MHIQESTLRHLRWLSSLSREENVLHAFLCYIDRLEVCGWRVDKERFYKKAICNILLLSLIPTKRNLLSTIFDGPPLSPERETFCMLSFAIQTGWRYVVGGRIRNFFITSGDSILKLVFTHHFPILKSQPCIYSKGGLYVCLQKIFWLSGEGVGYP